MTENFKKSFISYYNSKRILPVRQDIYKSDFVFKRNSLYKMLGLPLSIFKGRDIIEFGPGGGYNAVALTQYTPRSLVFVDASVVSLEELHNKRDSGTYGSTNIEIHDSNIFDFRDSRSFDLVIIEGVLSGQVLPDVMLKHSSKFVGESGFLVTTTVTAASILSEICRRIYRPFLLNNNAIIEEQITAAETLFAPHLQSLGTQTRTPRDWVLDCIFHDWEDDARVVFTMIDVLNTIGSEFDFYGSSPKFLIDDRFYKKIEKGGIRQNDLLYQQFRNISNTFIDYRVRISNEIKNVNANELELICLSMFEIALHIVKHNSYEKLDDFLWHLGMVRNTLGDEFQATKLSIDDYLSAFPRIIDTNRLIEMCHFQNWWGRGQQYMSLIKRE